MRLRNIPRADDTLQAHFTVIKNPKEFRGNWTSVFETTVRYGSRSEWEKDASY